MAESKKIILLDLGGVVFQMSGTSNEVIDWDIINQLNDIYMYELSLGKDKFPDFLAAYNARTHQTLTGTEFLQYLFDTLTFNKELIDIVSAYGEVIIVSDNYRENIEYISKRYEFDTWASQQFYSYDFEMYKSTPKFFKRLLAELKAYSKEDMILIDDSPNKLESAAKNGIKGILFENDEQVATALTDLGLIPSMVNS